MRRLVSEVVEDFRRQGRFERCLVSILVIGIVGYAVGVIIFWLLT